ncbi:MAG TPA: ASKHA domain-containing protein [Geobacteraceae bacterium]
MLAAAVDIGTTTLAVSLIDTQSGKRLAQAGAINPQREFGADVVKRLEVAVRSPVTREEMTRRVREVLERLVADLLAESGRSWGELQRVAFVGNPTMEHLLLGLPVDSLAFPPYRPLFTEGQETDTGALGWGTRVPASVFPLPGGFVGGDLLAFVYGCGEKQGKRLFLDLGTNGEIALTTDEKVLATSVAAGPAYEGGNLAHGMTALDGAISRVTIDGERVSLTTVGGGRPRGICGSGVFDAIAAMLSAGILDRSGRIASADEVASNLANRLEGVAGERAFVLYRDASGTVSITQGDIRQIQLANAAVRSGIEVLCQRAGIAASELNEVIVTGSFGVELFPPSLKSNGILGESMVAITRFVREGALAGAERDLCARQGEPGIGALARAMKVVPLSGNPAFEKLFFSHMDFTP